MYLKKSKQRKITGSGSGSNSQSHGYADPGPCTVFEEFFFRVHKHKTAQVGNQIMPDPVVVLLRCDPFFFLHDFEDANKVICNDACNKMYTAHW
jgi:hypothetical protein